MKNLFHNPVLVGELKIRMRGWKAALAITAYLGIMLLIAYLFFKTTLDNMMRYGGGVNANQTIGLQVYSLLAVLQFFLIVLITPAQTAGTISGEREKQTLDLLLCTKMSSLGIVLGKLFSSMSFILLLIIGSIPLFSLVFLFGGVTPGDVAMLFLFYLITAFGVGSIGIFCSTLFKRTVTATVVSYITIFILGILTLVAGVYMTSVYYQKLSVISSVRPPYDPYTPFVSYFNPFIGLMDLLAKQSGRPDMGLFQGFGYMISRLVNPYGYYGPFPNGVANAGGKSFWDQWPLWVRNSIVIVSVAVALLGASAWRIKPVRKLFKKRLTGKDDLI